MACPLAALASIATLAAEAEASSERWPSSASVSSDASAHRPPPPTKRPAPAASASAAPRPKKKPRRVFKRRSSKSGKSGKSAAPRDHASFPAILLGVMSAPHNEDAITFLSDGCSFVVVNPDMLARNVLPMHAEAFGKGVGETVEFAEFAGLLAKWGFESTKDPKYPEVNVYRHPQFRKGDWEACLQMKLPEANATGEEGAKSNDEDESGKTAPSRDSSPVDSANAPQPQSNKPKAKSKKANAGKARGRNAKARSVTPPELQSLLPGNAPSQFQNAAISKLVLQSQALEQMIAATAWTRRGLSGFGAPSFGHNPVSLLGNHPGNHPGNPLGNSIGSLPILPELHAMSGSIYLPPLAMLPPAVASSLAVAAARASPQVPSDAAVRRATDNVVSAAVAALQTDYNTMVPQRPAFRYPPAAAVAVPHPSASASSSLDAMTALFLEQSRTRQVLSRPGAPPPAEMRRLSDTIDRQSLALLAERRSDAA